MHHHPIDHDCCTGCHSGEVACKQERDCPVDKGGIRLLEVLTEKSDGTYPIDRVP